jgi:predicted TPR repeat methyltransferase
MSNDDSDDSDGVEALLARAYAVEGPDGNRALYADWAATYDETFVDSSRYVYHANVATTFLDRFDASDGGAVLDVGCGTGVVGEALRTSGLAHHSPIDGLDISPEMLAEAAAKAVGGATVYRTVIEADLTQHIDVPTDHYHGIVSAGAFTHGHLGPEAFDELFRVAAPGALCVIGVNSAHFDEFGFGAFLSARQQAGAIASVELKVAPIYAHSDPDVADQMAQLVIVDVG